MFAARPVATSRSSADSCCVLALGIDSDANPVLVVFTPDSKRALVMTVMPRFSKLRCTTLLTSMSSSGAIWGRYSRRVTFTPESRDREFDADRARPDDECHWQRGHLEDFVTGDDLLAVGFEPGATFTRDPLAMMTSVACRTLAALARRAVLGGLHDADPCGLPACHGRGPGDLVLVDQGLEPGPHRFTTWSRREAVCPYDSPSLGNRTPVVLGWRILVRKAADSRRAFVGMQPRWRHVPPILSSSTRRP